MSVTGATRIGLDLDRPGALYIPRSGYYGSRYGGGGEYGGPILNEDRTFAILREPVGHRVVATVAKDIFDNWFTLELEDAKEKENKAFDRLIQTELRRLRAKRHCTLMSVFERGYGYGIIVLGFEDGADSLEEELKQPTRLREIHAYGLPQITQVRLDKDEKSHRYMMPQTYWIKQKGVTKRLVVHHSRVIHFATRQYDPDKPWWQGNSVLDPIMDDLITLRNIRWSMGQTMFRYGSGFPVFKFIGAEKAKIQAWIDAGLFGDVSNRMFFAHNEKQEIEFKGLQGRALNPKEYYMAPMEHISAGTGIPLAILRGVQAGALTGSEVNQMEYYGIISDEQSAYEYGLRKLIDIIRLFAVDKEKVGKAKVQKAIVAIATDAVELPKEAELPAFTFNWKGGFELDEHKKQSIKLMEAQELGIRGQWHTRNEIRKMEDPEAGDLPEGQGGNEVLGASVAPAPSIQPGESAYHVQDHRDGSRTVRKLR